MQTVTENALKIGLHKLKVKRDALLMVHSSLSSFGSRVAECEEKEGVGHFEGGAEGVIAALLAVVSDGTVVMPTYTRYVKNGPAFDLATSPSDCGIITERFRLRSDVVRQPNHPTHSMAVWGSRQAELLAALEKRRSGTYAFFIEHKGQTLLIGIGHETHSFIHHMLDEAPEFGAPDVGRGVKSILFPRLEPWLENIGAQRSTQCGGSRLRLIDVLKARDAVHQALRDRPDLFDALPSAVENSYRLGKNPLEEKHNGN
jgi:aminoglycoside N3'-acetyltransferase